MLQRKNVLGSLRAAVRGGHTWTLLLAGLASGGVGLMAAPEGNALKLPPDPILKTMDASKLPPASTNKIDFVKDVKPILDKACMDCHDVDGPMGKFRLDKREAALKGGEKGVDIVPGKSEKSPLIFYAARLIKDMEMPPQDQGDPLTKEQVSLLRAWIDQGAKWGSGSPK